MWGWAFFSLGTPWVAQRVWAMPMFDFIGSASSADWSSATLPMRRWRWRWPLVRTARPAES